MKYLITSAALLLVSANIQAEEEYQYIETPVAQQTSDLTDDDYDGVINARDQCDDTPRGSLVDNYGCETYFSSKKQHQLKVLFANDSDEISLAFRTQIRTMAEFMNEYPETSIELQGYASRTGSHEHNLDLSKRRAKAVRKALIAAGVSEDRIRTVGFGDTVVADEGETQISHALNRRVVATVVGLKGEVEKEWTIFSVISK